MASDVVPLSWPPAAVLVQLILLSVVIDATNDPPSTFQSKMELAYVVGAAFVLKYTRSARYWVPSLGPFVMKAYSPAASITIAARPVLCPVVVQVTPEQDCPGSSLHV